MEQRRYQNCQPCIWLLFHDHNKAAGYWCSTSTSYLSDTLHTSHTADECQLNAIWAPAKLQRFSKLRVLGRNQRGAGTHQRPSGRRRRSIENHHESWLVKESAIKFYVDTITRVCKIPRSAFKDCYILSAITFNVQTRALPRHRNSHDPIVDHMKIRRVFLDHGTSVASDNQMHRHFYDLTTLGTCIHKEYLLTSKRVVGELPLIAICNAVPR